MADFVVGARFDVKSNELVPAAKAGQDELRRLGEAAKRAGTDIRTMQTIGQAVKAEQAAAAAQQTAALTRHAAAVEVASGKMLTGLKLNRVGMMEMQAAGVNAFQALAAGMSPLHIAMMEGAQVAGALVQGGLVPLRTLLIGGTGIVALVGGAAAAMYQLSQGSGVAARALETLNARAAELKTRIDALGPAPGKSPAAVRRDLEGQAILAESDIGRLSYERDRLLREERESRTASSAISLRARRETIERKIKEKREEFERLRLQLGAVEEAIAFGDPVDVKDSHTPQARTPSAARGARTGPTAGERALLREAEAAISARRALDEYAAASADIVEKAQAELSGKRALIAEIELEAQLRKRYGVQYVEDNRARITALAAERAAAQRVADQYRATMQFFESTAGHVANVLDATLVLTWDRSGDAVRNWESTVLSSLRQVQAELTRLAITEPLVKAARGAIPSLLGLLGLGGAAAGNNLIEAGLRHEGGYVNGAGPTRAVPAAVFAAAPRAHSGLYLAPNERPVIAQEGEAIFTPRQMDNADRLFRSAQAQSAPPVQVIINDQRSGTAPPVEMRQRIDASGARVFEVTIRDTVKKQIASGDFDSAMEVRYGAKARGG